MTVLPALAAFILAYLLGSIPFGLVLTRLAGKGDIRAIGSGNIGATNVLRTGSKGLAALTVLLDAGKGTLAVFLASQIGPVEAQIAAFGALLGHMFPLWLHFKGGKGVATGFGVMLALSWPCALIAAGLWLGAAFTFRYSSLAALLACATAPLTVWLLGQSDLLPLALALTVLIVWKHRANIQRLIRGEEPKIGASKHAAPSA